MPKGSFGQFMRTRREIAGVTLQSLAKHVGYSTVYLSDIERGQRNPPSASVCIKVAQYLGTPQEDFLEQAALERQYVHLSLTDDRPRAAKVALMLARRWASLTKAQLNAIRKILEE